MDKCPICLEEIDNEAKLNCGHSMCLDCATKWKNVRGVNWNCPLCRKIVRSEPCDVCDKKKSTNIIWEECKHVYCIEHNNKLGCIICAKRIEEQLEEEKKQRIFEEKWRKQIEEEEFQREEEEFQRLLKM